MDPTTSQSTESNSISATRARTPESTEKLEQFFQLIQGSDKDPRAIGAMKTIVDENPDFLNMNLKKGGVETPQEAFDDGKFGYLLTQDVLRHEQTRDDKMKIDPDAWGEQRPLHLACLLGKSKAVEFLLQRDGIKINAVNASKETALGIACRAANFQIAELLLKQPGIHLAQKDDVGNTPIHYLAGQGVYPRWNPCPADKIMNDLISSMFEASKLNAQALAPEEFGRLCFEVVCSEGSERLLETLLGVFPSDYKNLADQDGWTPLNFAIAWGNGALVKILLDHGANTTATTATTATATTTNVADSPDTTNAKGYLEFALNQRAYSIADMISSRVVKTKVVINELDHLKTMFWSKSPKLRDGIPEDSTTPSVTMPTVDDLLRGVHKPTSRGAYWYHFPANNLRWAKTLLEVSKIPDIDSRTTLLNDLQDKLKPTMQSPPLCNHGFFNLSKSFSNDPPAGPRMSMTVLPVIDIDLLVGFQNKDNGSTLCDKYITQLYDKPDSSSALHHPRTLDHYYYPDLSEEQQAQLNKEQVLTRHMDHSGYSKSCRNATQTPKTNEISTSDSLGEKLKHSLKTNLRILLETGQKTRSDEESQYSMSSEPKGGHPEKQDIQSDGNATLSTVSSNQKILIVSQIWLLKVDNLLLTMFPQRRDRVSNNENKQIQDSLLPQKFKKLLRDSPDHSVLYHEMVKTAIEYKSSIEDVKSGKSTSYLEIFSKEVLRLSRELNNNFDQFKKSLGDSDKRFRSLSKLATESLMEINDVVNELEMIRQVFDHRSSVWEEMHGISPRGGRDAKVVDCRWGVKDCDPHRVRDLTYVELKKIERGAMSVQKKANDLTTLLFGQASTENAIKASEQASSLAIFTGLTVVFSPLSFVVALLALNIDSHTPSIWTVKQISLACFGSVIATIALCAIYFVWLQLNMTNCLRQYVKRFMGPDSGRKLQRSKGQGAPEAIDHQDEGRHM